MDRRTEALALVALVAVAGVAAAGLVQNPTASRDAGARGQPTTPGESLDLGEANVVNVTLEEKERESGAYDFAVTLYHDDDGEDGYADRWVVETLNGTELGARELSHAHGTEPFTRSTTVEIPDDETLAVVRGRDQTHGYGGQAMVVNVRTGATQAIRQGPERRDLAACIVGDATGTASSPTPGTDATGTAGATTRSDATARPPTPAGGAALVTCPWEPETA
ncbi:hypothetical protein [Halorussus marinus]|uniref:hypothetical protein n=1 Tax=Halorussus marinus TaxID=2505976 RepID=UPI001AD9D21A